MNKKGFKYYLHLVNKQTYGNIKFVRGCILLLIFGFLTYFLVENDLPSQAKFEVGRPAPFDAKANFSVRLVDEEATQKARKDAADQVANVERFNPYAVQVSEAKIDNTISTVRLIDPNSEVGKRASATKLHDKTDEKLPQDNQTQQLPLTLSPNVYNILIKANDKELNTYSDAAKTLVRQAMGNGIKEDEVNKAAAEMIYRAAELPDVTNRCKMVASELASKAIIANSHYDKTATEEARQEAAEQVTPSVKVIVPGQIVVREGEIVHERDLPILEALNYYHHKITVRELVVKSVFVLVIMLVGISFVRICLPKLYDNRTYLLGFTLIILLYALVSHRLLMLGVVPEITPIVVPAMLIAVLFDSELAILSGILLAIYSSMESSDLGATASAILITMIAVLSAKHIARRRDMIHASLVVWLGSIICIGLFTFNDMDNVQDWLIDTIISGTMTGLVFSLLTAGAIPLMESMLNITSHMRLLELTNPTEPALNELLNKAPGTYQHSLMVSNLAASAAHAIGADALLCRTGAFYHDIGKTKQPAMFIENQGGGENPHDRLSPAMSAQVLISHVKLGLEMASQYKLPAAVTQFIDQHHGDNLASFFFQKAQEQSSEPLDEAYFRYPGPKPQTKETAIVMICDGIEAASRTLPSHTKEAIKGLVDRMVENALKNGQLSDCPLSLRDLSMIKQSIVTNLCSQYHSRINYPPMPNSPAANRAKEAAATEVAAKETTDKDTVAKEAATSKAVSASVSQETVAKTPVAPAVAPKPAAKQTTEADTVDTKTVEAKIEAKSVDAKADTKTVDDKISVDNPNAPAIEFPGAAKVPVERKRSAPADNEEIIVNQPEVIEESASDAPERPQSDK